jgi:mycoredoxin
MAFIMAGAGDIARATARRRPAGLCQAPPPITSVTVAAVSVTPNPSPALNTNMTSNDAALTLYTTSWCGYCVRLKTMLNAAGIAYVEVDIETDVAAADFVTAANGGNRTVPTVRFSDGSTLTNPDAREVKAKLAEVTAS